MKKEKPKPMIIRLYKSQRKTISRIAKKSKVSQAHVVRFAIDECFTVNEPVEVV